MKQNPVPEQLVASFTARFTVSASIYANLGKTKIVIFLWFDIRTSGEVNGFVLVYFCLFLRVVVVSRSRFSTLGLSDIHAVSCSQNL